jgi:hypothetical protein
LSYILPSLSILSFSNSLLGFNAKILIDLGVVGLFSSMASGVKKLKEDASSLGEGFYSIRDCANEHFQSKPRDVGVNHACRDFNASPAGEDEGSVINVVDVE